MERAGEIRKLYCQPQLPVWRNDQEGFPQLVGSSMFADGPELFKYVADFSYVIVSDGRKVFEDCKGVRTETYRLKKKIIEYLYGIEIKEV